jgi:hypothetical protein
MTTAKEVFLQVSVNELNIFIGWDSTVPEVSDVCAYSLQKRATVPIRISYLKLAELQGTGLYTRDVDPLASTEFTYSRFFTPYLSRYNGLSLFCDNDFLWLDDVSKLLDACEGDYPIYCIHQTHEPTEKTKMDGKVQTSYPRKNWSSLMLFNCSHPRNKQLDLHTVNNEPGSYLHQMRWLEDDEIGNLDSRWNWLEGSSQKPASGQPGAVHYTRGGPWLPEWRHCDYADLWLMERDEFRLKNNGTCVHE